MWESDEAFVYASWSAGISYGTDLEFASLKQLNRRLKYTLEVSRVFIACLSDSPEIIIGYCVSEGTHLHWVYVKPDFRRQGVATMLVPKDIKTVQEDTLTKIGRSIWKGRMTVPYR
jgi:ribosomal protein S18 acetylase RimI-like enzyme